MMRFFSELYFCSMLLQLCIRKSCGLVSLLTPPSKVHPSLKDCGNAVEDMQLSIELDIGIDHLNKEKRPHLHLNGLEFQLYSEPTTSSHQHQNYPKLPGINGPRPSLSTGGKRINVIKNPSFVSIQGIQTVDFNNGCWELMWIEDTSAGLMVCAYDVPNKASRNGATLPKGTLYMSFVIWKKADLLIQQARRKECELRAEQYIQEKDEICRQHNEETNALKRVLLKCNAARAIDKHNRCGILDVDAVPQACDVVAIENDLMITKKGTIWMKTGGKEKKLLGSALIRKHITRAAETGDRVNVMEELFA